MVLDVSNIFPNRNIILSTTNKKKHKNLISIRRVSQVIKWRLEQPSLFFARLVLMNDVKLYTDLKTLYRQTVKLIKIPPMLFTPQRY